MLLCTHVSGTGQLSCGLYASSFGDRRRKECQNIVTTPIPNMNFIGSGNYSVNISSYFKDPSGAPLTFSVTGLSPASVIDSATRVISGPILNNGSSYSVTGLPAGSSIDATTGVTTGPVLSDNNVYNGIVTVTAADAYASVSQPLSIYFPYLSSQIPSTNIGEILGELYTLDVSGYFISPDGQPFTFSATGLPSGSTINPTTGVISGTSMDSGPAFTVTVTGATICGQISSSFNLSFNSA